MLTGLNYLIQQWNSVLTSNPRRESWYVYLLLSYANTFLKYKSIHKSSNLPHLTWVYSEVMHWIQIWTQTVNYEQQLLSYALVSSPWLCTCHNLCPSQGLSLKTLEINHNPKQTEVSLACLTFIPWNP